MSEDVGTPSPIAGDGPAGGRRQTEREQRLAAALRENLRKRKAQARGREAKAPSSGERDS